MGDESLSPETLLERVISLSDEANLIASSVTWDRRLLFEGVSLRRPTLVPSELGFIKLVSWLYATIHEAGGVSVRYLVRQFQTWALDPQRTASAHMQTVHHMRTFLQHNLRRESAHDRKIMEFCHAWLLQHCGDEDPETEEQWAACLRALLLEAVAFMECTKDCLEHIREDDSRDLICRNWEFQVKRSHAPHEFEPLIEKVSFEVGQEKIDVPAFCKRYYNVWSSKLQNLVGDYEFEVEARKLIEHDLLHEWSTSLPITGQDVVVHLGVDPGPKVGRLLKRARILYDAERCNKETLLQRLQAELEEDS